MNKTYLPNGVTDFPPGTRTGEEYWEKVSPEGYIDCPEDKGNWSANLRWVEEEQAYRFDAGGKLRGPPQRPYVLGELSLEEVKPRDPFTWEGPELDALAKEATEEWYTRGATILGVSSMKNRDWMEENQFKVFRVLLSDLRRSSSRDVAARVLATRMGLQAWDTCPLFRPTTGALGGWILVAGPKARDCHEFSARPPSASPRGNLPSTNLMEVEGLEGVLDSGKALVLCLKATNIVPRIK